MTAAATVWAALLDGEPGVVGKSYVDDWTITANGDRAPDEAGSNAAVDGDRLTPIRKKGITAAHRKRTM